MSSFVKSIISTGIALIAYSATKKLMKGLLDYTYGDSEDKV